MGSALSPRQPGAEASPRPHLRRWRARKSAPIETPLVMEQGHGQYLMSAILADDWT